jgi:NTP pyrophosphatase (non-canonical NTP hydrolase)
MNLSELQVELRHFAAERDWQPFHTPKNLSTALMVEAAELAEIFQWMTPEESVGAHVDQTIKERIGEEVADVLLYLLQVADHSQIDIGRAVKDKLTRNALKYPPKQSIARVSPTRVAQRGTHVLLDYENVQPTDGDLRAMVPDASHVWVFHGPHQRRVEQRFVSFGDNVTAVPISRTGKNALDFHLSFYMGYIASRNQAPAIVVVANDKGYDPVLEHAKAMGFAVRQQEHGQAQSGASVKATPAAKSGAAAKPAAKKAAAKKATARKAPAKQPAAKQVPAKKAAATKIVVAPTAKRAPAKKAAPVKKALDDKPAVKSDTLAGSAGGSVLPVPPPASSPPVRPSLVSTDSLKKITDNLRKMGAKRPVKPASLRRALKSLLGAETGDESIEVALGKLITDGVVLLSATSDVSYPGFASQTSTQSAKA